MKKYFTTTEVADLCHASPGSVIRWIREGKLNAATTGGGHYRILPDDLIQFLGVLHLPVPGQLKRDPSSKQEVRVLIVDDDPGILTLIKSVLNSDFPHIRVEEAGEGFLAGWKASRFRPHLVILDLKLPGIDGFKICQLVRSLPGLRQTRILAITGVDTPENRERVLELGANDFLGKPFEIEVLKEKIEEQLSHTV